MGNGMNKIMPGLFIGNFRDAKDLEQLKNNKITHIVAIHDNAKAWIEGIEYKCIDIADTPGVDISQYFIECIDFIHKARKDGGNVLVHCIAGISRSCTISSAYIMVVGKVNWSDAILTCRVSRSHVNPNYGFQKQLQNLEKNDLEQIRDAVIDKFGKLNEEDEIFIRGQISSFDPNKDTGNEEADINALGTTSTFGNYERKRLQHDEGQK